MVKAYGWKFSNDDLHRLFIFTMNLFFLKLNA